MWLIFAIVSAFANSTRNLASKVNIQNSNEYLTIWSTVFFALIFSIPFVLYNGFVITNPSFWIFLILRIILDSIALITFMRALKLQSISFVIPIIALQPVLAAIAAYFISDQSISALGIMGMMVIVVSTLITFCLEIDFKNLKNNKNVFYPAVLILITIIFWSILDSLHKESIDRSSPYTYFFISNVLFTLVFSVVLIITKTKISPLKESKNLRINMTLGILLGIEFLSQLLALSSGKVAYISAIKSLSIVISPILSWIFLGEKHPPIKLVIKFISIIFSVIGITILILT